MNIPRPIAFSKEFRLIDQDEKFACECGKLITLKGVCSHSTICNHAKSSVEKYAEQKRNGLLPGRRSLAFARYYHSKEEYDLFMEKYRRVLDRFNRRSKCTVCGKIFYIDSIVRKRKTCSLECNKIACTNRNYNESSKKGCETRKEREKLGLYKKRTVWNKGMTGKEYLNHFVKDGETIDDAMKRVLRGFLKKTSIEEKMEQLLIELKIPHIHSAFVNRRQYDFKILEKKLLIEVDGDYWHGNSEKFLTLTDRQLKAQENDRIKDINAKKYGYIVLRFWESDINNNILHIKNLLENCILHNSEDAIEQITQLYNLKNSNYFQNYASN